MHIDHPDLNTRPTLAELEAASRESEKQLRQQLHDLREFEAHALDCTCGRGGWCPQHTRIGELSRCQ